MKQKLITSLCLIGSLSLGSCIVAYNKTSPAINTNHTDLMSPTLGGKLFTSAWIQRSAEYKALCHQAYNMATFRLEQFAASKEFTAKANKWAIVTDIDETILDNTPNAVHQALRAEDYTDESWDEWCAMAQADTLAGARDFFRRADALGISIYYISNRTEANRQGTLRNLQLYGFPQATDEHLMLRQTTSDKTARRNEVLKTHNILMLLGDNLGDFDHLFDSADEATRYAGVKRMANEFGRKFIVLPNPNYGTWEKAMNGGYPSLQVKDQKLRSMLRNY